MMRGRCRTAQYGAWKSPKTTLQKQNSHCVVMLVDSLRIDGYIDLMMVSNGFRPQSDHTPEGNQDGKEVRDEEHILGPNFEVFLDIPEAECRGDGAYRLGDSKVGQLKKRELDIVILNNIDQGTCSKILATKA